LTENLEYLKVENLKEYLNLNWGEVRLLAGEFKILNIETNLILILRLGLAGVKGDSWWEYLKPCYQ
jgi:hypothetical protein